MAYRKKLPGMKRYRKITPQNNQWTDPEMILMIEIVDIDDGYSRQND